ncbi:MAG: hypothetical protein C0506_08500 [Anaerolinea sp.]|nr:hypothetical protein [Anaerolinea sp.]
MISSWVEATFKALQHRDYRMLWIGTTVAFLAFMMSSVVQSLVAFDLTGKNGAVGLVAVGMGVSTILVSPFGGVIADRMSKRRLLLVGQSLIGINFATVGLLIVTDHITIGALVASTFVMGTVFSFIGPARQAWIGDLLPGDDLANGIALQQVSMSGTRIIGPFLASGLAGLAIVGTGGTYLFMGGLFAFVVFTLALLPRTQPRPHRQGVSLMGDMKLGVAHMVERPRLLLLSLSFIGMVMAGYSYFVVLPGLLENELNRDSGDIGWLLGISAVSGLAVTVGLAGMASSRHAWKLMLGGGMVLGVSLALLSLAETFSQALGAMLLVGAGSSAFQMLNNALVMQESDQAYYGRVMSITMLAWGFNGLAGYPFGRLADASGERATLLLMGTLVVSATLITAAFHAALSRRQPAGVVAVATVAGGK